METQTILLLFAMCLDVAGFDLPPTWLPAIPAAQLWAKEFSSEISPQIQVLISLKWQFGWWSRLVGLLAPFHS